MHRYLEYLGHDVVYVQNLTDVDDDMLRRARETGEDYLALGNRHVTTFLTEMAALNWLPPDRLPRATEHIPQMLDQIERLVASGHAYPADGHVYFSVNSWPTYGEVSKLSRDEMLPLALERGRAWFVPQPLDAGAMHAAAQHLVGHHDFTSFRAKECQSETPVKTLDRLEVSRHGETLEIAATARSFLHHQVRNFAGSLRLVGEGKWPPERVADVLAARDRAAAGPTAPPDGLFLLSVDFG
ncbi:MAG: tRNA pseudouridine(38-40) synthase TruA [Rhodovibrionaceae bacterium]